MKVRRSRGHWRGLGVGAGRRVLLSGCLAVWMAVLACQNRDGNETLQSGGQAASEQGLRKGIWLTHVGSTVFDSKDNLRAALQKIAASGFNTVYPIIWNKGYTMYPSPTVEALAGESLPPEFRGRDPLREIVELNKSLGLGLAIIPWFEYGLKVVFGKASNPANPDPSQLSNRFAFAHKAQQLGLLLPNAKGEYAWFDKGNGHFFGFLDPGNPQVITLLKGIAKEVTQGYPVDGFQIDDHFSLHEEFGHTPKMVQGFEADLAKKNLSDRSDLREKLWASYRADLVAEAAKEMASALPKNSSRFSFQISPAGTIGFSVGRWLQNWRELVHHRVVDEFVVQAYRTDVPAFKQVILDSSVQVSRTRARPVAGIFSGYKGDPRSGELLAGQINVAFENNMGVALFFYDTVFSGDAQREAAIAAALSSKH